MNKQPRIEHLLSVLGYEQNVRYYPLNKFSNLPSSSHLSRIISRINKNAEEQTKDEVMHVHGAYFIKTNPEDEITSHLRPVVFVAQASSVKEARELHRDLWNSSSAPFIIILLPDQIRVYTGFDYERDNENQGFIDRIEYQETNLFGELASITIEAMNKYSAEAIDSGSIWQILKNSKCFNYDNRVDKRLLRNLQELEEILLEKLPTSISKEEALKYVHPIIGKYVYFRYLQDRNILTNDWAIKRKINLEKVLQREATLSELLKLDREIEERFGGNIFPFPKGFEEKFPKELVSLVASVFCGDTAYGQAVLFDIYDFSYIPVETLSYIYEQFLRSQGLSKKQGAVYTPEALADYLINEISTVRPLKRGMKILDPCCGSGIFLVLTYRSLIELELQKQGLKNLLPQELKQIMKESIHGVELNLEACYVTEFSLILILLDYIEPPDLDKNEKFRFPNLHGKNIFEGDFFDPNKEFYPLKMTFDWIIGNPPWKGLDIKNNPEERNVSAWLKSNAKSRPVGDRRIEEAFAWRATEFVAEKGCVGFVLPAKRLFNSKSENFRREFFKQNEVRRITNFSNFHYLLFQAHVSAITIIYQKAKPSQEKRPIWHYSPFVANQIVAQLEKGKPTRPVWAIVINKNEIKMISQEDAEKGNALTWKIALWGSYEDERAIKRLRNTYKQTLGNLCDTRNWHITEGLVLRDRTKAKERIVPLDESLFKNWIESFVELNSRKLGKSKNRYHIPDWVIESVPVNKRYYRHRSGPAGLELIKAPHVVVNTNYAIFSDKDFMITGGQMGISAPEKDADLLKAVSIYLGSSLCRYLLFFDSATWGIDRSVLSPEVLRNLPIPSFTPQQVQTLCDTHEMVVILEKERLDNLSGIQGSLDSHLNDVLNLPESILLLIHDFFDVKLTLNKGKTIKVKAVEKPDEADLIRYASRLRDELDEFSEGGFEKHFISIVYSNDSVVCRVSLLETQETLNVRVEKAIGESKKELEDIKRGIQKQFNQWAYIRRELRFFDLSGETVYICKAPRLIDWTESQAIADANDIIGETLEKTEINFNFLSQKKNAYGDHFTKQPKKN